MSTVIIIQARMTSTRLPGKVLKPILGRPMLFYQVERLRQAKLADHIVVATTTNTTDDPIENFCQAELLDCIRGSEHDVLSRYQDAARFSSATTIVRVTSDCPLLTPELVDMAIATYAASSPYFDYVSNMIEPSWPYGMAVEVFSAAALAAANAEATAASEREHVTPFIYWRPDRYRLKSITMTPDLSHHRWTVDTAEDFELIRRIIESLYPINKTFKMNDVLALLDSNPDWMAINQHVQQKIVENTNA